MKLPFLFRQVHGASIFAAWMKAGQPPLLNLYPIEPLGSVFAGSADGPMPDLTVTIITVRCWNLRGVMGYEAATAADLAAAQAWADKHRDTPLDDFTWLPGAH